MEVGLKCNPVQCDYATVLKCYSATHHSVIVLQCIALQLPVQQLLADCTIHNSLHYRASAIHCSEYILIYCSSITGATYCNIFQCSGRLCNAVCFNCSALWCIGQDLISSANSNEQSLFLLHGENLLGNIFADIWQQR